MNDRDQRRYDRLTRVQTFGTENTADFAPASKARTHFTRVDQHITDLNAAKAGQTPARASKETLLEALVLDFKNISRTARAIALSENGFAAPYRIPDNPSQSAILTHADALLTLLEDQATDTTAQKTAKAALRAHFLAYELPADFVEDLRADTDAVRDTTTHNQGETLEGVENTEAIGQLLSEAARDLQELDALIRNKYHRDPAKLRAWQSASHVERAPVREKKTAPPVTPGQ